MWLYRMHYSLPNICISPNLRFHSVSEMGKGISAAVVVVDESDGTAPENPYD